MAPEHPAPLLSSEGRGETALLKVLAQDEPESRTALGLADRCREPPDPPISRHGDRLG